MRNSFKEKCWGGGGFVMSRLLLLALMLFGITSAAFSQGTIKGMVTDDQGAPLPGANVFIKGTTLGTISDMDGNYQLDNVPAGNNTLVVSFIGFNDFETNVGMLDGQTVTQNASLSEDVNQIEEVVAIGYGVQKKKLVTGATLQVKGDEVARQNTNNALQALQGQTPGMTITSTSGQPGSDMKVNIRGLGTVGNGGPLYIIDGVRGDVTTLNPADIESIDVLKDAASAAIYGAQAANGVVLITTKSGKEGKTVISFDAYYGVQNVARKISMLNAQEYMTIMNEQQYNSGLSPFDWNGKYSNPAAPDDPNGVQSYPIIDGNGNYYDTDWIDEMFVNNATTQSYTLGISGGNANGNYALSMGYMDQEGVMGGKDVSFYRRYNFRVNSEYKLIKDIVKVGEQIGFVYKQKQGVQVGNQYNNSLHGAFNTSPLNPVYSGGNPDYTSDQSPYGDPYNNTQYAAWRSEDGNPYGSMMLNNSNQDNNANFTGNVYTEIQPIKKLKFRSVLGVNYNASDYRDFKPLYHLSLYSFNDTRTTASATKGNSFGFTWTNTLSYDWKLDQHSFNALIGMESYQFNGSSVRAATGSLRTGFDDWDHAYVNNGTAKTTDEGLGANGNPYDEEKLVSYFARVGWSFKDTYMLNATVRVDGSSRFARGHRYGVFPSVSAGWILTNEAFAENITNICNYLKIRASWGQVGNQNIGNYMYSSPVKSDMTYYNFGNVYGASGQSAYWGAYPERLANEEITWETSEQFDAGFDARFLKSRLDVSFDFYIKTTKDWLVEAPVVATTGTEKYPYINGGDVKNSGVELGITWNDKIGKEINYSVSVNGAYNKNKVGNIPNEDGIIHGENGTGQLYDNSTEFYRAQNGQPIGYFWGFKTAGIFQNEQEILDWIAAGNGVYQSDVKPGDVKYVDINHDGQINEEDKVNLGDGNPDFTFGASLSMDYKGFDFMISINGQAGNQIVQAYRNHSSSTANYPKSILERWTGEGTSNKIPRLTTGLDNWAFSDLYIQDGDYLRINNLTIGYDFCKKLLHKEWISQCRLYFQVQNLATFTKYDGMDPEVGYGTDDWVSGVDLGYYPHPRTILMGVNLKF